VRRYFRIIYYISGIFLFVLIIVVGYTQTRSFKTYLRKTILQESQSAINGVLKLGSIGGNLITGFTFDSVTVNDQVGNIFSAERIELKLDLLGFPFKRVAFSNAVIVKPHIHIYRSVDGTWNVGHLIKSIPEDTLPSTWSINIKRVELADAEVIFTDSLLLHRRQIGEREVPPDSVIDYARIHLYPLSFVASAEIQHGRYNATIRDLSTSLHRYEKLPRLHSDKQLISQTPIFVLTHLSGDFLLTKNEASAKNLRIETSNSRIRLDAGLNNIDITRISSVEELKYGPVELSLLADGIDTRELKQFLYPPVNFLDREIKIQLKAYGTFENLNIEQLAIQMPHSFVQLQGQLRNLHHPADLEISAHIHDSYGSPSDLLDHLPGLKLPDLTFLGNVRYSLTYEGRPLNFKTHFIGNTAAGDIDLDAKMKIDAGNIIYSGTLITRSIALEKIFQNEKISSNLNTKMTIDGAGFNPLTMTGLARVEVDSSLINGLPVQHSVFVFDIADGLLRSHVAASAGSGTYEFSSQLELHRMDSTDYSITGRIRSLDLAEILQDKKYKSEFSFDLTATGTVGALARSDTAEIRFLRSAFETETFESAEAKVIFWESSKGVHSDVTSGDMKDSVHSALQITSTIGDLSIDGNFTPASFIAAWQNSYELISNAIAYRFRNLDSLRSVGGSVKTYEEFQPSYTPDVVPVEARYQLYITNLKPVGVFFHVPLLGYGLVEGTVIGDSKAMQFDGNLDLEQFALRSGTDTLTVDSASFRYLFSGIGGRAMFETLYASLEPDLRNFEINSLLFNQISGRLKLASDSSDFQFSAFIDSTALVNIKGTSRLHERLMEFEIPELKIELGKYKAENKNSIQFALGSDGLLILPLTMVHEKEEASIAGYFSPNGISDFNLSLYDFTLSNLKQILHRGLYAKSSTQFDGKVNATSVFRGSFINPSIVIDLQADDVRADDLQQNKHKMLGRINSHLSYSEYMLNLFVTFISNIDDQQAMPDLLLSGSLPYEFVLVREAPHKLEGDVNLTLRSTGMNLEFLNPFIPEISDLSGMMTCDMQMKGPIDAPVYEGSMSVQNASFVFNPLGLKYILNGNFIPIGDRIQLQNFTIQNDSKEKPPIGAIQVSGDFKLLGLKLKQFDFLVNGDLKVMSENKRLSGQKLYGNLFAATGSRGLVWQGDLSASTVRGEVFIKEAQLVLPPEREAEFIRVNVVDRTSIDDTSHLLIQLPEELLAKNGKTRYLQYSNKTINGLESSPSAPKLPRSSFLDGISYDLSIETKGSTQLRFVFNTQTSEELFADLQGRLYFNRTPEVSRMTGQVDVVGRSYYNFIKKFEAKGKLLYTGDILNPELDVLATYQGTYRPLVPPSTSDTTVSSTQANINTEQSIKEGEVLVTLKITGTRNEPKTKISLQIKSNADKDWQTWQKGDEEANAISYIVSGQFRDELTDQQRMGLIGTNLGASLAVGMVTGPLSDLLRRKIGVIQSVDVIYNGGQFDQSDVRLTGQVGEAVIRAGGRVLNDIANTNVSVELPVSTVVNSERYRNLILTLERRVEGIQNAEEQRRASNGVRLFYRITF
jgi:hypothetical protein